MAYNPNNPNGQATMANSRPVVISSDQSTLTVTANAGTNLNTSALALETGGNLAIAATNTTGLNNTVGTAASAIPSKLLQIGGSDGTNARAIKTNTSGQLDIRPLTSSDQVTIVPSGTQTISGSVTIQSNASVNVAQLAGTATDTNSGTKSAGTLRVVLATDQPQLTSKLLVTPDANSAVNVAQINGVTTLMGNGTTGTGSQRVTLASDNTAIAGWGQGATGAAVPSGAQYKAGIAKTALPTAASDGNLTGVMTDKFGRQVTLTAAMRDLIGSQRTTISASTSETTIVTAAASIFNDIFLLTIRNTSATAVRVDIRDTTGGTIIDDIYVPAGEMRGWNSGGIPVPQTSVNTNWTAQCSASVTDVRITAWFIKNK